METAATTSPPLQMDDIVLLFNRSDPKFRDVRAVLGQVANGTGADKVCLVNTVQIWLANEDDSAGKLSIEKGLGARSTKYSFDINGKHNAIISGMENIMAYFRHAGYNEAADFISDYHPLGNGRH